MKILKILKIIPWCKWCTVFLVKLNYWYNNHNLYRFYRNKIFKILDKNFSRGGVGWGWWWKVWKKVLFKFVQYLSSGTVLGNIDLLTGPIFFILVFEMVAESNMVLPLFQIYTNLYLFAFLKLIRFLAHSRKNPVEWLKLFWFLNKTILSETVPVSNYNFFYNLTFI